MGGEHLSIGGGGELRRRIRVIFYLTLTTDPRGFCRSSGDFDQRLSPSGLFSHLLLCLGGGWKSRAGGRLALATAAGRFLGGHWEGSLAAFHAGPRQGMSNHHIFNGVGVGGSPPHLSRRGISVGVRAQLFSRRGVRKFQCTGICAKAENSPRQTHTGVTAVSRGPPWGIHATWWQ